MCDTNHDKSDLGLLAAEVNKLIQRLDEIKVKSEDEYTVTGRIPKTIIENLRNLTAKPDTENKAINAILAAAKEDRSFLTVFCLNIQKIESPVDLYEHNEEFRKALNKFGIYLEWGTKASRSYNHAYVLRFGEVPGEVYSIITDHCLDDHDPSTFLWNNYDVFGLVGHRNFLKGETN
jgi:hypothetical protein